MEACTSAGNYTIFCMASRLELSIGRISTVGTWGMVQVIRLALMSLHR